jgi:hypothetical protein
VRPATNPRLGSGQASRTATRREMVFGTVSFPQAPLVFGIFGGYPVRTVAGNRNAHFSEWAFRRSPGNKSGYRTVGHKAPVSPVDRVRPWNSNPSKAATSQTAHAAIKLRT